MIFGRSFLLISLMWMFALNANSQGLSFFTHEVRQGETLYSISVKYGVSVDLLKRQNNINSDAVKVGQTLRILRSDVQDVETKSDERPECRLMYKVQKKETIYSICKKFDLSEEEFYSANPILREKKLKKRQLVCIPFKSVPLQADADTTAVVVDNVTEPLDVALILPFGLGNDETTVSNMKMIDFYEGFLMSLESIKSLGMSANVFVYDETEIDSTGIVSYLSDRLDGVDVVIGPYDSDYLEQFLPYAKDKRIKVVVPFTSKSDYTQNYSNVFQLNVPQAEFYSKVYGLFMEESKEKNLIFMLSNDRTDNVLYFEGFKKAALEKGTDCAIVDINSLGDLNDALSLTRENVIIPISPTEKSFTKIVNALDGLERVDTAKVVMFGQSNWQQFMGKYNEAFMTYDCTFFSKFLYDSSDSELVHFQSDFSNKFGREQYLSYPMYGVMGYDLGLYFLSAYNDFGKNFADHLPVDFKVKTLQTPISFERKRSKGGYSNNKVMFVSVRRDGSVRKVLY